MAQSEAGALLLEPPPMPPSWAEQAADKQEEQRTSSPTLEELAAAQSLSSAADTCMPVSPPQPPRFTNIAPPPLHHLPVAVEMQSMEQQQQPGAAMEDGEVLEDGEIDDEPAPQEPAAAPALQSPPPKTASSRRDRKSSSSKGSTGTSNNIEDFLRQRKERLQRKLKSQLETTTGYRSSKTGESKKDVSKEVSVDTDRKAEMAPPSLSSRSPSSAPIKKPSPKYRDYDQKEPLQASASSRDSASDAMMNSWMTGLRNKSQTAAVSGTAAGPQPSDFDHVDEFDSNELFYNQNADLDQLLLARADITAAMTASSSASPPSSSSTVAVERPSAPIERHTAGPLLPLQTTDGHHHHAGVAPMRDEDAKKTTADRDFRQSTKADKDYRSSAHGDRDYRAKDNGDAMAAGGGGGPADEVVGFGDRDYRKERRRRRSEDSDDDERRGARSTKRSRRHYTPPPSASPPSSRVSPRKSPSPSHSGHRRPPPTSTGPNDMSPPQHHHAHNVVMRRHDPSYFGRSLCKFFREGYCRDGLNCTYSHDASLSRRRPELCKFYQQGFCKKTRECPLLHGEYPCKAFHKGECTKQQCPFSHMPLDDFTRGIYERMLKDEELASRITIPAQPSQRKVLLPNGPPSYELLDQVKQFEAKCAAKDLAHRALSPASNGGMASPNVDRSATPTSHTPRHDAPLLAAPPTTTAAAPGPPMGFPPHPPPHGFMPPPFPMPPTGASGAFDFSQMPMPPFFPPPFPMPMPMPMPPPGAGAAVPTTSTAVVMPGAPPPAMTAVTMAAALPPPAMLQQPLLPAPPQQQLQPPPANVVPQVDQTPPRVHEPMQFADAKKEEDSETSLNDDTPSNPTFSINEMLKKIQAQHQPKPQQTGGSEESPASPPPQAPSRDEIKHVSIPQNIPQMGRPVYRLVAVDVPHAPNSNVEPALLSAYLSDTKLRNDPRLKKLLDSQFNAVSNIITKTAPAAGDAVSPNKAPQQTASTDQQQPAVGASAGDPRKHRDPRLRRTDSDSRTTTGGGQHPAHLSPAVPKPSQASDDEIQKLVDLQLKMAAAMGTAGGLPRMPMPPTAPKQVTDIPPPGLITPSISSMSPLGSGKLPVLSNPSVSKSDGLLPVPQQPAAPATGGGGVSWMPQLGRTNGGGGGWPSPPGAANGDARDTSDNRQLHQQMQQQQQAPLTMREKRKDNVYESPLNRDSTMAAGNVDSTSRYNQMPNVRVRRKTSPSRE